MNQHVALLGDSTFDNRAYTRGEPEVVAHLARMLPPPWQATLLAVDGATTTGIAAQVARVPVGVSHLVVSVGGNDALRNIDMLDAPARSSGEALDLFAARLARFERDYQHAVEAVRRRGLPTTLCTIYDGNLVDPIQARRARIALTMFDDVIARTAHAHRLDLIELRRVCTEPADYANPIEPSGRGGEKIARAIARALGVRTDEPPGRVFF